MKWYYAKNGKQAGPIDDEELAQLLADGTVVSQTLVWREGMENWQPYAQVVPDSAPAFPEIPPLPVFEYAGFWIRFAAKLVDGVVLLAVNFVIDILLAATMSAPAPAASDGPTLKALLLQVLVQGVYQIYFLGKFSATPGKMACGLKVVRPDGTPLTYERACGRFFSEIVTGLTIFIGYIIAAFDDEKRTLHDRLADTRVIMAKR